MQVTLNKESQQDAPKKLHSDGPIVITDSRGRVLKLKKLSIIEESRLVRMLGQESVTNQIYMNGYVMPAVMVAEIDGDAIFTPNTQRELEALIQRLDNDGIRAILDHIQESAPQSEGQEKELKN